MLLAGVIASWSDYLAATGIDCVADWSDCVAGCPAGNPFGCVTKLPSAHLPSSCHAVGSRHIVQLALVPIVVSSSM